MADIEFTNDMTVKLVRHLAADDYVIQAAQVSAKGENKPDTVAPRLINSLLKGKHGSPFEHASFTFFVEVPIFVVREWQRHRISSFNEMSGRYTELLPKFYVPSDDRPMIPVKGSTSMKPNFEVAKREVYAEVKNSTQYIAHASWNEYQRLLGQEVAKEVARTVLPLSIYTQFYWTVNARSLMNFLSLRGDQAGATVESYPQREIQIAAEKVEKIFEEKMPLTHEAWLINGRVAP
jgi:thymidylate synthase (FAD)